MSCVGEATPLEAAAAASATAAGGGARADIEMMTPPLNPAMRDATAMVMCRKRRRRDSQGTHNIASGGRTRERGDDCGRQRDSRS